MQRTSVRGDCPIQCRMSSYWKALSETEPLRAWKHGNVAQKVTSGEAGHLGLVQETIPQMIRNSL